MSRYDFYPPYESVGERLEKCEKYIKSMEKKGVKLSPVRPKRAAGSIAETFWGKRWCQNVESYQDYASRLPRGRSYVRSGNVLDLQISKGTVKAKVMGSQREPYNVEIQITPLPDKHWNELKSKCAGKITSVMELLQGKLPNDIIRLLCNADSGLFPKPKEIKMKCSCPDWAGLCKHLAAVLYGVGVRLDENPRLFFVLRGLDENELEGFATVDALAGDARSELVGDLKDIFGEDLDFDGIEFQANVAPPPQEAAKPERRINIEWNPDALKDFRRCISINQKDFAKEVGLKNPLVVSKLENGKEEFTDEIKAKLDSFLDLNEDLYLAGKRKKILEDLQVEMDGSYFFSRSEVRKLADDLGVTDEELAKLCKLSKNAWAKEMQTDYLTWNLRFKLRNLWTKYILPLREAEYEEVSSGLEYRRRKPDLNLLKNSETPKKAKSKSKKKSTAKTNPDNLVTKALKKQGVDKTELAEKIGVTYQRLYNWEKQLCNIPPKYETILKKLCK